MEGMYQDFSCFSRMPSFPVLLQEASELLQSSEVSVSGSVLYAG
jgi:hypothetical protein